MQCMIDIIEAIENNFECEIENYEGVIAILQLLFASAQFLFIFQRGNVIMSHFNYFKLIFVF